jgi:hypothetical protein
VAVSPTLGRFEYSQAVVADGFGGVVDVSVGDIPLL